MYKKFFKPVIDVVIASVALLLLSPIMLVIALLLAANNGGTPFFVQNRPGKNGKIFSIIKFKTMNNKKDAQGVLLPDYRRLTFMGKIVRKTSLDELPQLINVVLPTPISPKMILRGSVTCSLKSSVYPKKKVYVTV